MHVFRIEYADGQWRLLKAHGYKTILSATDQAPLIEHALALTHGEGAIIRFESTGGVRELRVGAFKDEGLE